MNRVPAEYASYILSIKAEPVLLPANVVYGLSGRVGFLIEQMALRGFSAGDSIFHNDSVFVKIKKEDGKPESIVLEDIAKRLGLSYVYNGAVHMRPASHFV